MVLEPKKRKGIIINLIKQDFELINLFSRLDAVGFSNIDFPSITYEIFDLMGIPEESRTDKLLDQYSEWVKQMRWIEKDQGFLSHVEMIYHELSKLTEFSYVHA